MTIFGNGKELLQHAMERILIGYKQENPTEEQSYSVTRCHMTAIAESPLCTTTI